MNWIASFFRLLLPFLSVKVDLSFSLERVEGMVRAHIKVVNRSGGTVVIDGFSCRHTIYEVTPMIRQNGGSFTINRPIEKPCFIGWDIAPNETVEDYIYFKTNSVFNSRFKIRQSRRKINGAFYTLSID